MNLQLHSYALEAKFARAALHGFGHAFGLKHVYQVTPSVIPWNKDALYSYYETNQHWSKAQVNLNVLNLLAADTLSSPNGDSVMLYSISASLTTNEVSIQGEGALTARDISVVEKLFPSWNDLNVSTVPTIHNIVPPKDVAFDKEYTLHQPISPAASAKPKAAIGLIDVETGTSDPWIRIYSRIDTVTESNIDLKVGSWGKTQLFRGTSSLFWATPQSLEPNPIFQTGVLNVKAQAINQWVKFDIRYKTWPKVFVDISGIDLGGTLDLDTTVVSTNRDGFYVNIHHQENCNR